MYNWVHSFTYAAPVVIIPASGACGWASWLTCVTSNTNMGGDYKIFFAANLVLTNGVIINIVLFFGSMLPVGRRPDGGNLPTAAEKDGQVTCGGRKCA